MKIITAPKLFIGSEGDTMVPFAETRRMFDLASGPKELQSYPGSAHGVHIFLSKHGDELRERLIAFIMASVPPA